MQRHYFANKDLYSQSYGFSSSHVWMWVLDHKDHWTPKNQCFWTVVLKKTLESPLDCKEIKLVHPKGNQSWIFIGRTDAEAEAPILWLPDAKSWLIGQDSDAGKDWRHMRVCACAGTCAHTCACMHTHTRTHSNVSSGEKDERAFYIVI